MSTTWNHESRHTDFRYSWIMQTKLMTSILIAEYHYIYARWGIIRIVISMYQSEMNWTHSQKHWTQSRSKVKQPMATEMWNGLLFSVRMIYSNWKDLSRRYLENKDDQGSLLPSVIRSDFIKVFTISFVCTLIKWITWSSVDDDRDNETIAPNHNWTTRLFNNSKILN